MTVPPKDLVNDKNNNGIHLSLNDLIYLSSDINRRDNDGFTVLHSALVSNNLPLFSRALQVPNIDINVQDSSHRTPLHIAAHLGHTEFLKLLLSHQDINVNIPSHVTSYE